MREADFLFELIQRLDEKEYKYVQEFALSSKSKVTQQEQLLADLRKQKEYNPQLLKPKYKGYEVLKFRLRQLVMQALRAYHEEDAIEERIALHLQNERILYRKGIYHQAVKELDEAQSLATKHQKLGRLLEILQIRQFRLMERQTNKLHAAVVANFDLMDLVLDAYRKQIAAFRSYQELFAMFRTTGTDEDGGKSEDYVPPKPPKMDFYRQLYENALMTIETTVAGDTERAAALAEEAVALFESEPDIMAELILIYKIQLGNLGVLLAGSGQYARSEEILKQLKSHAPKDFNDEAETFQNVIHIELLLMVNQRKFQGQANLIERVENGLQLYGDKVNYARKLSIWYNLMVLYLANENWRKAREMVELIVSHRKFEVRKEIQYTTRLLELIMLFELKSWDWLEHPIVAAKQYLKRNKQLGEFKQKVLKALMNLVEKPLSDQADVLQGLEASLVSLSQQPPHPDNLGMELVAAWASSRRNRRPLKDCLTGEM